MSTIFIVIKLNDISLEIGLMEYFFHPFLDLSYDILSYDILFLRIFCNDNNFIQYWTELLPRPRSPSKMSVRNFMKKLVIIIINNLVNNIYRKQRHKFSNWIREIPIPQRQILWNIAKMIYLRIIVKYIWCCWLWVNQKFLMFSTPFFHTFSLHCFNDFRDQHRLYGWFEP